MGINSKIIIILFTLIINHASLGLAHGAIITATATGSTSSSIIPSGSFYAYIGEQINFTANPSPGNVVNFWAVDNDIKQLGGLSFGLTVTANHNVTVHFTNTLLTILASVVDVGGSISPNGTIFTLPGDNISFQANPPEGHSVEFWILDGKIQQLGGLSFELNNIYANHEVIVKFDTPGVSLITADVSGTGGNINPSGLMFINSGSNKTFIAEPSLGYIVDSWAVDGNTQQIGGLSFELNNVTSNVSVSVSFRETPTDIDCDDILDENDNCLYTFNPGQLDADNDGIGDSCEFMLGTDINLDCDVDGWDLFLISQTYSIQSPSTDPTADSSNYETNLDLFASDFGQSACPDLDSDGVLDDGDFSGVPGDNNCTSGNTTDCDDNCIKIYNPDQLDSDNDGIGDSCDGIPLDGLISYWSFDQDYLDKLGLNNANDVSGSNTQIVPAAKEGAGSIEFGPLDSGDNVNLNVTGDDIGQEFSWSLWFKSDPSGGNDDGIIGSVRDPSWQGTNIAFGSNIGSYRQKGKLNVFVRYTNNTYDEILLEPADTGHQLYNDGLWHHLVFTVDSTQWRLFVDNVEVATKNRAGKQIVQGEWHLGYMYNNTHSFLGNFDEVLLYNRPLTLCEIDLLYNNSSNSFTDLDSDGVLDDGDFSGVAGDNNCTNGDTTDCDDNCIKIYNPDQLDSDNDGIGDACDGIPLDGLISYWPFDQDYLDKLGLNNANDVSGSNTKIVPAAKEGAGSIEFGPLDSGDNVHLNVTGDDIGQEFSWSLWFKSDPSGGNDDGVIGSVRDPSWQGTNIAFGSNSKKGKLVVFVRYSNNTYDEMLLEPADTGHQLYNDGLWHHLVFTVDSTQWRLFVDNVEVATKNRAGKQIVQGEWHLGYMYNNTHSFLGNFDELLLYNRSLTVGEINQLYSKSSN